MVGWLDLTSTFGKAAEQRRDGGGGGGSDWILCIGICFLHCYAFLDFLKIVGVSKGICMCRRESKDSDMEAGT